MGRDAQKRVHLQGALHSGDQGLRGQRPQAPTLHTQVLCRGTCTLGSQGPCGSPSWWTGLNESGHGLARPVGPVACRSRGAATVHTAYLATEQTKEPGDTLPQCAARRRGLVQVCRGQCHFPAKILGQQLEDTEDPGLSCAAQDATLGAASETHTQPCELSTDQQPRDLKGGAGESSREALGLFV